MFSQKLTFLFVFMICGTLLNAQTWTKSNALKRSSANNELLPAKYIGFDLDFSTFENDLDRAKSLDVRIELPTPDGALETFIIEEANVFHPDLSAKYPGIKAYKGYSLDVPGSYLRMGYGGKKVHAMILREGGQTTYIDHIKDSNQQYAVYFKGDYGVKDRHQFECLVEEDEREIHGEDEATVRHGDCQLRKYRLALACTAEYANFHGGTVASVLEEYNVAMTRVNGLYERDAGITMELVPNTDELIFFNANTDPYANNNGGTMLNQNQNTCDDIIGSANYDIGHVFSTGGGGIAQLRSPCGSGDKARGVTGLPSPINDPFYIDYVAHEMGHQFGANHTQNNSCQRNGDTAMEPGSASTIMGYAGICAPNVQNNSDDHFHAISLIEISNFITGNGNSCAEIIPTTNSAPEVSVDDASVTIPASTPFFLTANATDVDGDMLTYCWEQMDNEIATMPPQSTNTGGPLFRSNSPISDSRRFFPDRVNGESTWEVLPSVSREMNFICTVRDNNTSVGCTGEVDVEVDVFDTGNPFRVTEPNTAVVWPASDIKEITWDVSGTDQAPINASNVDIFLSLDSGETFDIVLAEDTPNDGSFEVVVPDMPTDQARVVIVGNGVFYDLSDQDFSITAEFSVEISPFSQVACGQDELVYTASLVSATTFDDTVELSVSGLPDGATAILSENSVTTPASVDITISGLTDAVAGQYIATLSAMAESTTIDELFTINIQNNDLQITNTTGPVDGVLDVDPTAVEFTWEAQEGVSLYQFQMSTTPEFITGQIISATATSSTTTRNNLEQGTVYYWRVRARSICSNGAYSVTQAFRTSDDGCQEFISASPEVITELTGIVVESPLEVPQDFDFSNATINVDINHSFIGDLSAQLVTPEGVGYDLFDRPGVPGSQFGCGTDNIQASFNNSAVFTATDFENTCDPSPLAISGLYQPIDLFGNDGLGGQWTLLVTDAVQNDGGQINSWSIEVCEPPVFPEVETVGSKIITVANGGSAPFDNNALTVSGSDPAILYITRLPVEGALMRGGEEVVEGALVSADDLSNGAIAYIHSGNEATMDEFLVDVQIPATGAWLRNETIAVEILENGFQVVANVTQPVSCFEGADGVILATAVDGTEPYEFSLDGNDFQSEATFEELPAGDYVVYVRDSDGVLSESATITLSQPDPILLSAFLDGYSINASAEGGAGEFEYSIDGTNFNSTGIFPDLDNGDYDVIVRDANDCVVSISVNVNIDELMATAEIVNLNCSNVNDGSFTVLPSGGISPYEYSLNDGPYMTENEFTDLAAGNYEISVRDAGGREVEESVTVFSELPITYGYSVVGGSVTIVAEGGVAPYMYSINGVDFQMENVFDLDITQDYTLTIMDDLGCVFDFDLSISSITSISFTTIDICFGATNGSIIIDGITGGVAPYEYSINDSDFQNEAVFSNLIGGVYDITVRDGNGSEYTESGVVINENPEIGLESSSSTDTLFVNATGGAETGFSYSINGEGFNSDGFFTNLPDGDYSITVMDASGCVEIFMISFTDVQDVLADNDIKIYPNPVAENLQVELLDGSNKVRSITLLGIDGKLVLNQKILANNNLQTIDVRSLTNGVYILYVVTEKGSLYQRVSVMK